MFLLFFLIFLFSARPSHAAYFPRSVTVSALIGPILEGQSDVTIFGYTAPFSKVELSSLKVADLTVSESDGYFEFPRTLLPKDPGELCFASTDPDNRRSTLTCIPPPPPSNIHTQIGPVLLSPTLTLDSALAKPGATILASGRTVPLSTVNINFFQKTVNPPLFPKAAMAFILPKLSLKADKNGLFSFNLPTVYSSDYRLYASAALNDDSTPKSNTLSFHLPSLLYLFWLANSFFIIFTPIFVATLSFFFYLLYLYLHPHLVRYLPALYPKALIKPYSHLLW